MNTTDHASWIGKSKSVNDALRPEQAQLLSATIGHDRTIENGSTLPALWHWVYFQEVSQIDQLGRDGHASKGEFLPPIDLPRRMWAGGRLDYQRHAKIGERLTKTSTIKDIKNKTGKTGQLCFVTVRHEYFDHEDKLVFSEEHDIVYREDPQDKTTTAATIAPPENGAANEVVTPSSVLLFRYSALTFNSHRIHYDRDYCINVEGYPGLIFHGPLTATLLAEFAGRKNPDKQIKTFSFRATAPLFDTEPFAINTDGRNTYWAETPNGRLAMKAEIVFE